MRYSVSLAVFLSAYSIASLGTGDANASKSHHCHHVGDIARVGTYDSDSVVIEEGDDQDGAYCNFSINGNSVESPDPVVVAEAFAYFQEFAQQPGLEVDIASDPIQLAWLLIAAGDDQEPTDELLAAIDMQIDSLQTCFTDFFEGASASDGAFQSYMDDGPITCRIYGRGFFDGVGRFDQPILEVATNVDGIVRRLYLPRPPR